MVRPLTVNAARWSSCVANGLYGPHVRLELGKTIDVDGIGSTRAISIESLVLSRDDGIRLWNSWHCRLVRWGRPLLSTVIPMSLQLGYVAVANRDIGAPFCMRLERDSCALVDAKEAVIWLSRTTLCNMAASSNSAKIVDNRIQLNVEQVREYMNKNPSFKTHKERRMRNNKANKNRLPELSETDVDTQGTPL
jgi:hypothetical protein